MTIDSDLEKAKKIIVSFRDKRWPLLPLLEEIQENVGYIPPESIPDIAEAVGLFPSQVQGILSFYALFYTRPQGKNIVRVCRGTACHVRGGKTVLKLIKQHLNLEEGETSPDYKFSLETVACIGCCAQAPNIVVNKNIYGHMNPRKITAVIDDYGRE